MLEPRTEMLPEASNWSIEYIMLTGQYNVEFIMDQQCAHRDCWTLDFELFLD